MGRIICGLGEDVKFEGVWSEAGCWKLDEEHSMKRLLSLCFVNRLDREAEQAGDLDRL